MKVHANSIFKNDATKEFYFGLMEFTFLQLGIKANFLKFVQNKEYIAFMLFQALRKNENFIHVTNQKII
jgi:hypothetical protein